MTMNKSYRELYLLKTFDERLDYLTIKGSVGSETFGCDRRFNQIFYRSAEWKKARDIVIARDLGCDLGISDRIIYGKILVHHINPITMDDIRNSSVSLFDTNNLICVSHDTHNMIHYGIPEKRINLPEKREPGDTILWKRLS